VCVCVCVFVVIDLYVRCCNARVRSGTLQAKSDMRALVVHSIVVPMLVFLCTILAMSRASIV
jgi:hypothetical protein